VKLSELKKLVDVAIELAEESEKSPDEINVYLQIDGPKKSVWASEIELHYDNDCQASGCVLVGEEEPE